METGKLPTEILGELIQNIRLDKDVIVGPKIGIDAAKIKTNNKNLIIGSDPITFNTDNVGKYCVSVNANDIAVSGAIPKYFMSTILLPPHTKKEEAIDIFNEVKKQCDKYNISLIGGHTEITDSVTRPIISGTMIGEEVLALNPKEAEENCHIVLINKPAIEGTCILANSGKEKLIQKGIKSDEIDYASNLINTQDICVYPYVKEIFNLINENNSLKLFYMHDPTEGGIATALEELSNAIDKKILVHNIEFMKETIDFCKIFNLDPMGLISSGSLLCVTNNGHILEKHFAEKNIYCKIIGKVMNEKPMVSYTNGNKYSFNRDEIARFFEEL